MVTDARTDPEIISPLVKEPEERAADQRLLGSATHPPERSQCEMLLSSGEATGSAIDLLPRRHEALQTCQLRVRVRGPRRGGRQPTGGSGKPN